MVDNNALEMNDGGSDISFHDLTYSVQLGWKCLKKSKKLTILHDINGMMRPGLNAIMGPTGGGKTTLLNLLAGRTDKSRLKGRILVDGMEQPYNFKCMSGYVAQDDIVMGTLTVRENLMFSANLRLPKCISREEKEKKVEDIIYELGLKSCADTKVGTALSRGISGGERKRTNIGMELIISPKVLFLDEPTTGLDSSTANAVMQLLKTISQTGKTIVFSIHQPRYNIFKLFDTMLLLSSGRVIYHGPSSLTLDFFKSIGYECEEHNNPSDFFLDVANGDSTAVLALKGREGEIIKNSNMNTTLSETIHKDFLQSDHFKSLKDELGAIERSFMKNGNSRKVNSVTYATSFFTQLFYLSKRSILNMLRNPYSLMLQVIIMTCLGLLSGVIYFQMGNDAVSGIQNRVGLMFFIVMNQIFGNTTSLELFLTERVIFVHESTSGFYRVSAYFFTKFIFDIFPMRLIPLTLLCVTCYFMAGFQLSASKFLIFYFILVLTASSSSSIGFAVGSWARALSIAHLTLTMIFVFMQIFGGFLVNLTTMTEWLSWMQYLSIVRYALNALSINELSDIKLYNNADEVAGLGPKYLKSQGIRYETSWDLWQNNFAMFIITVVFLLIAYLQLLRKSKLN